MPKPTLDDRLLDRTFKTEYKSGRTKDKIKDRLEAWLDQLWPDQGPDKHGEYPWDPGYNDVFTVTLVVRKHLDQSEE